ncbi:MAG: ABC transporter permease [Rhodobacteraceae bacterium]|nr:ABC transporter permease [Paracoccaceae bacterium]
MTDRSIEDTPGRDGQGWRAAAMRRSADLERGFRGALVARQPAALAAGLVLLGPIVLAAAVPALIAPFDPFANVGPALAPPGYPYLFGTDNLGRDLFSGVVAGARTSLLVASLVATISIAIGLLVGVTAGFFGGHVDDALMRVTEFVQVLPRFFIALLVLTLFGASVFNVVVVLGLFSWPGLARLARAETLSHREREYVRAAVALGGSNAWIMRKHILPQVGRPVMAVAAPVATGAILTEAGLSFLGLSDPNVMSWGRLIQNGQTFFLQGWWLALMPGLAVVATCLGLTLLLEGYRRD